jgi:phenylpropionate dioxygenase-like ring-hydroxylating dioxygenase large terminal subunit
MIPANGRDAPVPSGFDVATNSVREHHGIIWYWYGAHQPAAELPWHDEIAELGGTRSPFTTTPRSRSFESWRTC